MYLKTDLDTNLFLFDPNILNIDKYGTLRNCWYLYSDFVYALMSGSHSWISYWSVHCLLYGLLKFTAYLIKVLDSLYNS